MGVLASVRKHEEFHNCNFQYKGNTWTKAGKVGPTVWGRLTVPLGCEEGKPHPSFQSRGLCHPSTSAMSQQGIASSRSPTQGLWPAQKTCFALGPGLGPLLWEPPSQRHPTYEMASTMASPMRMEQTAWSSR